MIRENNWNSDWALASAEAAANTQKTLKQESCDGKRMGIFMVFSQECMVI
jgi:hypothetical protein